MKAEMNARHRLLHKSHENKKDHLRKNQVDIMVRRVKSDFTRTLLSQNAIDPNAF